MSGGLTKLGLLLLLALSAALGGCDEPRPEEAGLEGSGLEDSSLEASGIEPLPEIDPTQISEEAAERLESQRRALDELLAAGASPSERAAAYGQIGELYQAYGLDGLARHAYANAHALDAQAPRWVYLLAVLDEEAGQLESASERYRLFRRLRPDDRAARLRHAEVLFELGASDESEALYRSLLGDGAETPSDAAVYYGLGRLASAEGRLEDAVAAFERALELQPQAANVHSLLAVAYRRLGDEAAAQRHVEQIGVGYTEFDDPILEQVEARVSGVGPHVERALEASSEERYDEAVAEYLLALEEDPANSAALRGVALNLRHQERFDEAIDYYSRLLELEPDHSVARLERATVMMESGRVDESIAALEELAAREPEFEQAHYNLGVAYLRAERPQDAVAPLAAALALDPDDPQALFHLALARQATGDETAAVDTLQTLLESTPTHVPARQRLGTILLERGELATARDHFLAVVGFDAVPAEERGLAAYQAGRAEALAGGDATVHFERAVELFPELGAAHFALGRARSEAGEHAAAASSFRRAAALDERNLLARQLEVENLGKAQRWQEAAERLDEYQSAAPRSAELAQERARLLALAPAGLGEADRALEIAQGLFQSLPTVDHAETLVIALAATGAYDEAETWQAKLIRRAEAEGRDDLLPRLRANLERYRSRRPPRLQP